MTGAGGPVRQHAAVGAVDSALDAILAAPAAPEADRSHTDPAMPAAPARRVIVGFSGGLDSTVLLHALARRRQPQADDRSSGPAAGGDVTTDRTGRSSELLAAVHINHHLHPAAGDWQRHCESICRQLDVEFSAIDVDVPDDRGIEAAARDARYAVWESLLRPGDRLLLGHHRDDQVETLLLRLILRGGGAESLAGIPARRPLGAGMLARPFLALPRATLATYAEAFALDWINDPGNETLAFDRNFLRHEILPLLRSRWPGAIAGIARAADRLAEDAMFVALALDLAVADCQTDSGCTLAADRLLAQPAPSRVLRHWLTGCGVHGTPQRALDEMLRQFRAAGAGGAPLLQLSMHLSLRRHRGTVHLVDARTLALGPQGGFWQLDGSLCLPSGTLRAHRQPGPGLSGQIDALQIGYPGPGMRLQPHNRRGSRTVVRLLQEADIPPWQRPCHPVLLHEGNVVAVPGIAVAATHAAGTGANWQLTWQPALTPANVER